MLISIFESNYSADHSNSSTADYTADSSAMIALNETTLNSDYQLLADSDDTDSNESLDQDAIRTYASTESDYEDFENCQEVFETESAGPLLISLALILSGLFGVFLIGSTAFCKTHDAFRRVKKLKIFRKA